jgi:arginase
MPDQDAKHPPTEVIQAPWNIGLRPDPAAPGALPGTWRAPQVLAEAGLTQRLASVKVTRLPRPPYDTEPQPGTWIRNGRTLREHGLLLAEAVANALEAGRRPVVVGGDCSILLGCLAGARRRHERVALLHVDGHADFGHPGNQDPATLSSAAGMDLALSTGRGDPLLTRWPGVEAELVRDQDAVQLGDREAELPEGTVLGIPIEEILASGPAAAAERAIAHLAPSLPIWLHLDLDVLDGTVLPAVDSPGSPGLTYPELTQLLAQLHRTGRILGADIAIYDPDLDPGTAQAPAIVDCLAAGLGHGPA